MKNLLIKTLVLVLCLGVFSCEEDFLNIDSDVKGAQNFKITSDTFPVTAYSKATGPVQANGLPLHYIGVLKDKNYTATTTVSNLITEIVPTTFNPQLGTNPKIDSVSVFIPFFSTVTGTDASGNSSYNLEKFLGDKNATYKLTILKSNYLLRDLDPNSNFEEAQKYYSDFYSTTLEAQDDTYTVLYENSSYKPNEAQVRLKTFEDDGVTVKEITRTVPGIREELFLNSPSNMAFWNDLMGIVDNGSGGTTQVTKDYLANANSFKEYFRGLIFKVEATSGSSNGSFIALNLSNNLTGITLDYTNDEEKVPGFVADVKNPSVYRFGFNGIRVNTNTNSTPISVPTANTNQGNDNLYLRGLDGAFTVVDLFGTKDSNSNGISDAFEDFQTKKGKWLINEANITFTVNNTLTNGDEPSRVLLYDLSTNQPIADYFFDQTSNANPELSRIIFSEPLTRDASGNGVQYKLRVTEHINNLLIRDGKNVKLGLFISNDINDQGFVKLKNPITLGTGVSETIVKEIPQQSVVSNRGIILNGTLNATPAPEDVKFEIYYTEEK